MAINYLDKTGLALVWAKIQNALTGKVDKVNGKGLSTNDYTSDEKTKLANVAAGAQVNVLEGIQRNGTTVTATNKIANILVPTATSDLTNDSGFITTADIPEGSAASTTTPIMDGTAAVGTELAFARGDHIHPTDTSRAAASDVTALTTRVGSLETAVGSGGSVDSKIASAIATALSSTMTYKGTKAAVNELPSSGNAVGDVWHVSATGGEYAWDGTNWQELGSIMDLSSYVEDTDLVSITSSEIDTICV